MYMCIYVCIYIYIYLYNIYIYIYLYNIFIYICSTFYPAIAQATFYNVQQNLLPGNCVSIKLRVLNNYVHIIYIHTTYICVLCIYILYI